MAGAVQYRARYGIAGQSIDPRVPEEYAIHKEKEFTFNKIRRLTVTVCCGAAI